MFIRPNKKISMFPKNIVLCFFKGILPLKMHKIIYFFKKNFKKNQGFISKFR